MMGAAEQVDIDIYPGVMFDQLTVCVSDVSLHLRRQHAPVHVATRAKAYSKTTAHH